MRPAKYSRASWARARPPSVPAAFLRALSASCASCSRVVPSLEGAVRSGHTIAGVGAKRQREPAWAMREAPAPPLVAPPLIVRRPRFLRSGLKRTEQSTCFASPQATACKRCPDRVVGPIATTVYQSSSGAAVRAVGEAATESPRPADGARRSRGHESWRVAGRLDRASASSVSSRVSMQARPIPLCPIRNRRARRDLHRSPAEEREIHVARCSNTNCTRRPIRHSSGGQRRCRHQRTLDVRRFRIASAKGDRGRHPSLVVRVRSLPGTAETAPARDPRELRAKVVADEWAAGPAAQEAELALAAAPECSFSVTLGSYGRRDPWATATRKI